MAVKSEVKTTAKATATPLISVRIQKVFDEGNKVRAVANVNIGGAFAVHGIKVIDSEKGLFVSMPSNSYKNNNGETKYQDIFHPITAEARTALSDSVIIAYERAVAEQQSEDISQNKSENVQSM